MGPSHARYRVSLVGALRSVRVLPMDYRDNPRYLAWHHTKWSDLTPLLRPAGTLLLRP